MPALFPEASEPAVCRYTVVVGACVIAFCLRLFLEPVLHDHSPMVVFTLAVAVSSIRGFGPGILATFLSASAALYFFRPVGSLFLVEPEYRATAIFQISVFLVAGCLLSWFGGTMQRLRSRAAGLAKERENILGSITDGFAAVDNDYRLTYLNQAAAKLANVPGQAVIGNRIWDAFSGPDVGQIAAQFHSVLETHSPVHFEYRSPVSDRWLEFHVHPGQPGGLTIYFGDITPRKRAELRLQQTLDERDKALQQVHVLSGLLPICANCKKIRDNGGVWHSLESYISDHSEARFSHGMCADCAKTYYDDLIS